jgi:mutator protein MutT
MSDRRDYYDDPQAPQPNSIVPAGSAVIVNAHGDILLQRRNDNGLWALPGGALEIGETMSQAVVREVEEETGVRIVITGLVGLYTDPRHVIAYADGEVRQQFNICFKAEAMEARTRVSEESSAVRFIPEGQLAMVPMHPTTRLRLQHYLERRQEPYLG